MSMEEDIQKIFEENIPPEDSLEIKAKIKASILIYNPMKGYGQALDNMLKSKYSSVAHTDSINTLLQQLADAEHEVTFIILENYDEKVPELEIVSRVHTLKHRANTPIILVVPSRGQNFQKAEAYRRKDRNIFIVQRPYDLGKIQRTLEEAKKSDKLA